MPQATTEEKTEKSEDKIEEAKKKLIKGEQPDDIIKIIKCRKSVIEALIQLKDTKDKLIIALKAVKDFRNGRISKQIAEKVLSSDCSPENRRIAEAMLEAQ